MTADELFGIVTRIDDEADNYDKRIREALVLSAVGKIEMIAERDALRRLARSFEFSMCGTYVRDAEELKYRQLSSRTKHGIYRRSQWRQVPAHFWGENDPPVSGDMRSLRMKVIYALAKWKARARAATEKPA